MIRFRFLEMTIEQSQKKNALAECKNSRLEMLKKMKGYE